MHKPECFIARGPLHERGRSRGQQRRAVEYYNNERAPRLLEPDDPAEFEAHHHERGPWCINTG